jgi:hypothetical protein
MSFEHISSVIQDLAPRNLNWEGRQAHQYLSNGVIKWQKKEKDIPKE